MGSWSTSIMGSDDALDAEASLFKLLGISHEDQSSPEKIKIGLNKLTPKTWHAFVDENNEEYRCIKQLAAAFLIIKHGARLPAEVAQAALTAAREEGEQMALSRWNEPQERKERLLQFQEAITDYDGQPTNLLDESLFDVWTKKKSHPSM